MYDHHMAHITELVHPNSELCLQVSAASERTPAGWRIPTAIRGEENEVSTSAA